MMEKQDLTQAILRLRERMAQSSGDERARERELLRFAGENLDETKQRELQNVLRDRQALQELLQSESAKALLQRLRKGE